MKYINHWPVVAELVLPEAVSQNLHYRLLEPFNDEDTAREFWDESSSTLIILDHTDTIEDLQGSDIWAQIEFALTYPEYTVPMPMGYQLSVAIVNDSGSAIYLVVPHELSRIIPGGDTHE